jgi:hypothetical protein
MHRRGEHFAQEKVSQDRSLEVLSAGCSEKQEPEAGNVVQQFEGRFEKKRREIKGVKRDYFRRRLS